MDETPRTPGDVALEDQRQAAIHQSEQLVRHVAATAGVKMSVRAPNDPCAPAASKRVLDDWVDSINGDGPKGLCMHLRETSGPQPCGGFPFMPGGLFCWECIVNVMGALNSPDCPGQVPCPGCGMEVPLFWGSATIGMHTLVFGLCRACSAEDEFSEGAG